MNIQLININKKFGDKKILNNFNATFEPGMITAVMGASGSGKTTLLNIICLIEPFYAGSIMYGKSRIVKRSAIRNKLKFDISFVFQNYGLLENESVFYNLSMSHRIKVLKKAKREKEIKSALKLVDLSRFEDKEVYTLSGGEQQRVAIAKAMLKQARIILADEPTASIDEDNARLIMDLLRKMADDNKIVIVVTHSHEVATYADKIIYLE